LKSQRRLDRKQIPDRRYAQVIFTWPTESESPLSVSTSFVMSQLNNAEAMDFHARF
jgi:hypothetical protein